MVSVWLAETSRKLGSHVAALAAVMPDSELLFEFAVVAPNSSGVADGFESWGLIGRDAGCDHKLVVGIACGSIDGLAAECEQILDHCASHCDGPLARVVTALRLDLVTAGSGDSPAIGGVVGDPPKKVPRFIPDVLSDRGIDFH